MPVSSWKLACGTQDTLKGYFKPWRLNNTSLGSQLKISKLDRGLEVEQYHIISSFLSFLQ